MKWNYERIKVEAKNGRQNSLGYSKVEDLLVLARQNDPFYVGTDNDRQNAEWFAELFNRFGYIEGVHLRRIHYQIISQDPKVEMPNGKLYENTEKCWQFLNQAAKSARYLELVDPAKFEDRRASKPIINYDILGNYVDVGISSSYLDMNFKLPEFPGLPKYGLDMNVDQLYQVEIWTEKSTMNDVLQPLCEKYGVNLVAGVGEMSITQSVLLMERLKKTQKPCRILYVSDFDPAGLSMPVAAARKTEFLYRNQDMELDIELQPVVLTYDQCVEYKLPRTPIKETERRAGKFEERWGEGATELDALESLYPGELRKILEEHILRFYDESLNERLESCEDQVSEILADAWEEAIQDYREEYEKLQAEYEEIKEEFESRVSDIYNRTQQLMSQIRSELKEHKPDLGKEQLPENFYAQDYSEPLFDSTRSYLEQLQRYKQFQNGINEK